MPSLIDQLKFQPVDPVITAHSNAAGRNSGQETEDGEFRHSIARLLSVRPGRHQIPGGIPTKGASAGQIFCRIVTIFYQKTECYGNSCQYDIHQCALLHVEPPFFMAFFPKSKLSSSCLPNAFPHPLFCLLQAYLCAQRTLMSIQKPQCQRPFQPSIQIMIQYSSVMEKFFIIAMKPGRFPGFLSADGHRCGIYPAAFFNKLR